MKSSCAPGPRSLWPLTLIIGGWLACAGWHLPIENETLRASAATEGNTSKGTRATPEPINGQQVRTVHAEALREEKGGEVAAREAAEAKIAELESHLPTFDERCSRPSGASKKLGCAQRKP